MHSEEIVKNTKWCSHQMEKKLTHSLVLEIRKSFSDPSNRSLNGILEDGILFNWARECMEDQSIQTGKTEKVFKWLTSGGFKKDEIWKNMVSRGSFYGKEMTIERKAEVRETVGNLRGNLLDGAKSSR